MRIISNYIFRQITVAFLCITLFFISLIWLITSLRFIEYVTNNGLDFLSFILMTSLLIPSLIPYLTPLTLALACIFVYDKLSNDNELTIIKASGINRFQIVKPAVLLAILVSLFNLFLNLYISPLSKTTFKENQKNLRENIARIAFKENSFSDAFKDIVIYVEDIIDSNHFSKIFVYDQRNKDYPATYIADTAELIQEKFVNKVILKNGNRQFISKKDSQLNIIMFDKYEVNLDALMEKKKDRLLEPEEMMLRQLWDKKHLESGKYDENQILGLKIEGHKRIISPIYCIIFTLISITFLLSKGFIFKSTSNKISLVLFAIFFIELIYLGLPNLLIKKPSFLPTIYIVPLLLIIFLTFLNISKTYKVPLKK